jgi:GAF domain-containing protein
LLTRTNQGAQSIRVRQRVIDDQQHRFQRRIDAARTRRGKEGPCGRLAEARAADPSEVFSAVAEEMARCLKVANTEVHRYDDDGTRMVTVGCYAEPGVAHLRLGESRTCEGENVSTKVWHTGRPARMDSYERASGNIAARMRDLGIRSRVGAPVTVYGRVWGMALVGSRRTELLPADTEERIGEFADLIATAIAASTGRGRAHRLTQAHRRGHR